MSVEFSTDYAAFKYFSHIYSQFLLRLHILLSTLLSNSFDLFFIRTIPKQLTGYKVRMKYKKEELNSHQVEFWVLALVYPQLHWVELKTLVYIWLLWMWYDSHSLMEAHGTYPFLRSHQLCSYSRIFQIMEHEGSLTCSKEPSTGLYPQPDQSNPYHPIPSKIHFSIVHPPTSWSS
jgi:hypothetical protein